MIMTRINNFDRVNFGSKNLCLSITPSFCCGRNSSGRQDSEFQNGYEEDHILLALRDVIMKSGKDICHILEFIFKYLYHMNTIYCQMCILRQEESRIGT